MKKYELRQQLLEEHKRLSDVSFLNLFESHMEGFSEQIIDLDLNRGDYRCMFFSIEELVDPDTLSFIGESGCWALFDVELLMTIDWLRLKFGPASINTGRHQSRGYRTITNKYYSKTSMHSVGCAFDLVFKKFPADAVRNILQDMLAMQMPIPQAIRRIENHVSWLHIDSMKNYEVRNGTLIQTRLNEVYLFNPGK